MTLLTADYSDSLVELIRKGEAPIDGIEVGAWFSPGQVVQFQQELPGWSFQYHAGSLVSQMQYRKDTLQRLAEFFACTQSAWLSIHIELLPYHTYVLSSRFNWHLRPPRPERAVKQLLERLEAVRAASPAPLILENLPSLPLKKYAYATDPGLITEVVEATGSGFLLDIAHARIAASLHGMETYAYLEKLPLERTQQIHLSGPRLQNGSMRDAHEPLEEEDYALLAWVLERTRPQVVTLEYFREREPLRQQLWRLREMIPSP